MALSKEILEDGIIISLFEDKSIREENHLETSKKPLQSNAKGILSRRLREKHGFEMIYCNIQKKKYKKLFLVSIIENRVSVKLKEQQRITMNGQG